ncbi:hypothetical protein ACRQ5Q_00550 [Bradyrhizobium sp. PMVTL-01]|uniref:hypothetical protein n=1 Tax=Bradyrhizobium sp. PMVTL-01 TaxID=3434999 RepID=UPI003F718A59
MSGRRPRYRTAIDVNHEPLLEAGPAGAVIEVIGYDAEHTRFYAPVDLNKPELLMENGLSPKESDPRFHQQMVYAVAIKVMRPPDVHWAGQSAFITVAAKRRSGFFRMHSTARIAFFEPNCNAVFFGYFRASALNPGPNCPGKWCLLAGLMTSLRMK